MANVLGIFGLHSFRWRARRGVSEFYIDGDITRAKIAMILFAIPVAGFIFTDYQFFNWSLDFFSLSL
jgi:hypothetical protein